jgi:hypothetical protein
MDGVSLLDMWRSLRTFPGKMMETAPPKRSFSNWKIFNKVKMKKIDFDFEQNIGFCWILFTVYTRRFASGTASSGDITKTEYN